MSALEVSMLCVGGTLFVIGVTWIIYMSRKKILSDRLTHRDAETDLLIPRATGPVYGATSAFSDDFFLYF